MHAVILAGGKGTRLRPYTNNIPKPLVPLGDKPILEILFGRLKELGVDSATLCVNHLAHLIKDFCGDGSRFGIEIDYSMEDKPLSTVAPIKLIDDLPDNFFVMNGDLLTDIDFRELMDYHLENEAKLTVAAYQRTTKIDFGVIEMDEATNTATGFREKPEYHFNVSMGVYCFKKEVLDLVPEDTPFGFDNLMYKMLETNDPVKLYPYSGYWLDIGRPDDYERAQVDIETIFKK